ncbi:MAG TPA: helix-turn-helix domain-containing protein [Prolixibacteraceae bacterium]
METLKFTIIKSREQYDNYCNILEELVTQDTNNVQDEIDLLTLLIEKWDNEHTTINDADPIEILKSLMAERDLKSKDLVNLLGLSKGTISKILNYNKGLSKETIRNLSDYFKVSQETFNRPYRLINEVNKHFRNARLMNTKKNMVEAR